MEKMLSHVSLLDTVVSAFLFAMLSFFSAPSFSFAPANPCQLLDFLPALCNTTMSKSMAPLVADRRRKHSFFCRFLPTVILLAAAFFIASAFIIADVKEWLSGWRIIYPTLNPKCVNSECGPYKSLALPKGIVAKTSNLEMRPLWGHPVKKKVKSSTCLLAIAAGIKQKVNVNKIVKRFPSRYFVIMLFHHDGIVNDWMDLGWSNKAIHVSAVNQTKWWFAKRFLHPDIVEDYAYIFLWDGDLVVNGFDAGQYLSIIKAAGLEISQPALDHGSSDVHHQIADRKKGSGVPRWTERVAPIFSRAAWRCVWHLIQNDLAQTWRLDTQLGQCTHGNETKTVGIVDSNYVIHYGLPMPGGLTVNATSMKSHQRFQNLKLPNSNKQVH